MAWWSLSSKLFLLIYSAWILVTATVKPPSTDGPASAISMVSRSKVKHKTDDQSPNIFFSFFSSRALLWLKTGTAVYEVRIAVLMKTELQRRKTWIKSQARIVWLRRQAIFLVASVCNTISELDLIKHYFQNYVKKSSLSLVQAYLHAHSVFSPLLRLMYATPERRSLLRQSQHEPHQK